ncbi:unnamed protein product, partial [Didymodactylos carnosus]
MIAWDTCRIRRTVRFKFLISGDHLVELKSSCPEVLKELNIGELTDISFIEACKLFARGSASGTTRDCKSKCATKHYPCKRAGVA